MINFKNSGVFFWLCLVTAFSYFHFRFKPQPAVVTISTAGKQPAVAFDREKTIHVVFGKGDQIEYASSADGGKSFTRPAAVATLPGMHLGMTRGPQIAVTKDFIVVAAVNKDGRIMAYQRKKQAANWSKPVNLVDTDNTAPEGFVALAAGAGNSVYAAWLDTRQSRQNNVYSAYSTNGGRTWSKNKLVYASPEGKVCECCRPSVAADAKGNVYVMFRNNVAGARDMYLAHSPNGGKTFLPAQKLGLGTWLLKACPMEGGGLALDTQGKPVTTWKRENEIFVIAPGLPEEKIGEGRACTVASSVKGNFTAWQQNGNIMVKAPGQLAATALGAGNYPRLIATAQNNVVIWEAAGGIVASQLP